MSGMRRLLDAARRGDVVPSDERRDLEREAVREIMSGISASDIRNTFDVDRILLDSGYTSDGAFPRLRQAEAHELTKGVTLTPYRERAVVQRESGRHGALYYGEMGIIGPGRPEPWASKPMSGGLEFLDHVARHLDIWQAGILTRQRLATTYANRWRENDNQPVGFVVSRADGEKLTKRDQREAEDVYRFIENCGDEANPEVRDWQLHRSPLQDLIAKQVADTYTADATPMELELTHGNRPVGVYALPFDTIRLAHEDGYDGDDRIVAIQLDPYSRVPAVGFEADEILYPVRNPRTSLAYHGYGQAELEHIVRVATSYLNAFAFNAASLDRKELPRGFLTLFGKINPQELTFFKQQWQARVTGAINGWTLPILAAKDRQTGGAAYTKIDDASNEMFSTKWIIFLSSLMCAFLGMDPAEVNLEAFTSKTSNLSGENTAERLQNSRDKGFVPLMLWFERIWNTLILPRRNPKFVLKWVGLFPADEQRKHDRLFKAGTFNDVRSVDSRDPLPAPFGDCPVDPNLGRAYLAQQSGGDPGAGGWYGDQDADVDGGGGDRGRRSKDTEQGAQDAERAARRHEQDTGKAVAPAGRLVVEIRDLAEHAA